MLSECSCLDKSSQHIIGVKHIIGVISKFLSFQFVLLYITILLVSEHCGDLWMKYIQFSQKHSCHISYICSLCNRSCKLLCLVQWNIFVFDRIVPLHAQTCISIFMFLKKESVWLPISGRFLAGCLCMCLYVYTYFVPISADRLGCFWKVLGN